MKQDAIDELSPYELKRLAKIRRNQKVLVSLGLKKLAPRKPTTPSRPKQQKRPPTKSIRKSSRIAAIPAPSVYVDSERANCTITLGGVDAETLVVDSSKKEVEGAAMNVAEVASDEDPAPKDEDLLFSDERKVYALLREEKNVMARELDTAAYHVAQNRALMAMVRCVPRTPEELLDCWGWGEAKVSAHGDRLMGAMASFVELLCERRTERTANASDCPASAPPSLPIPVVPPTRRVIAETFNECDNDHDNDVKFLGPLPVEPSDLQPFEQPAFNVMLA